ncbi:MAG: pantoate--beta-alanine ligase [Candidatus Cloacimonetes bacterium]|nr:pantoate--beta-alanine ligase [Candidatus Cloacimonadota bacterium]
MKKKELQVVNSVEEMIEISSTLSGSSKIGFVPTMGYLHEGHLSLVKEAQKQTEIVIVSIFVNPTQFAPTEDLANYPRSFERDLKLLEELEVDYVFFPTEAQMYPADYKTYVNVEEIGTLLCGKTRPIHFRGVSTVVAKLVNITRADFMFMGKKDFQQIVILEQMLRDLNFSTKIIRCDIVREKDGLAMSSRNSYLSTDERRKALCLYQSLLLARKLFSEGIRKASVLKPHLKELIEANDGIIDYIEFADPSSLLSTEDLFSETRVLLAVKIGKTRLIDNMNLAE